MNPCRFLLLLQLACVRASLGGWLHVAAGLWRCALGAVLGALFGGCAVLPPALPRAPSYTPDLAQVAPTALARIAADSLAAARAAPPVEAENEGEDESARPELEADAAGRAEPPDRSALRLLGAGDQALDARIALIRRAQASIALQTYLFDLDSTGLLVLRELRAAAARGVRVRLLIDDLHAAGHDDALAAFAALPNVELRLFNPLPARSSGYAMRIALSLHELGRINRRMHNKLFVADNAVAIVGGRNIADEYFRRSAGANFIDLDLLAVGPVVPALSASFDAYWNSPGAYDIRELAAPPRDAAARLAARLDALPAADPTLPARDPLGQASLDTQLADGLLRLEPAAARLAADEPAKITQHDAPPVDGRAMQEQIALMQSARSELWIVSPYVVPGAPLLDEFRQAAQRRVRVTLMTNSSATTDEPLAYDGYARCRARLLAFGVSLRELVARRADADEARVAGSGASAAMPGASTSRLHAKLTVVDRRWLYVGSLNLDRRSAHSNTEVGVVVDSPALAAQVAALRLGDAAPQDGGDVAWQVRTDAPPAERRTWRRWLIGMFIGDEML